MTIWECPHPEKFLDEIFSTLQNGDRHVLIHLPIWRLAGFQDALWDASQSRRLHLHFPEAPNARRPLELMRGLSLKPDDFQAADPASWEPKSENIALAIPSELNAGEVKEWLGFIEAAAASGREFHERMGGLEKEGALLPLPWRLIFLAPAHFPSPKPETSLEIFLASGLCGQSDLEWAVERCASDQGGRLEASSRLWLESICKGVAMRDVGLCASVFKALPLDLPDVMDMLMAYPFHELGKELAREVIAVDEGNEQGPESWRARERLREMGILDLDCRGWEALHPSALAQANRRQTVEGLLRQGQVRVYFPLAQDAHSFIVQKLDKCCDPDWRRKSLQWHKETNQYVNESDTCLGIGPLAEYMARHLKGVCGGDLLELARLWQNIRNEIAHDRLLKFEDTVDAVDLFEEMRQARI